MTPNAKLVPLTGTRAKPELVGAALETLWGGPETLIVISSDLSHYLPYAEGRRIDEQTCKRIYRLLTIDGYARIDLRLTASNQIYFIEANPNPILAADEDFALSAGQAGLAYPQLIDCIIRRGLKTLRD